MQAFELIGRGDRSVAYRMQGRFYWEDGRQGRGCPPFKSLDPLWPPNCSVKWLHCAMSVFVTSLCLAFSDADIKFDFVLMTSAYSPYLKDGCRLRSI